MTETRDGRLAGFTLLCTEEKLLSWNIYSAQKRKLTVRELQITFSYNSETILFFQYCIDTGVLLHGSKKNIPPPTRKKYFATSGP